MSDTILVGELTRDPLPLRGRVALITGVSRRNGIGFAVARRLAAYGAHIFAHHFIPHDARQPWGADPDAPQNIIDGILAARGVPESRVEDLSADLSEPEAPHRLFQAAVDTFGHVDVLVCNHAQSGSDGPLGQLNAAMLDSHWAVNARASILLAQEFANQHDGRDGGRIIFLTSGQGLGPMPGEVAYAASKGTLAAVTLTLADQLADRSITVNTVNPGPVDTGYASAEMLAQGSRFFPSGRWGTPDDAARLIAWLATDEARWITGQVIHSEGGFRRWASPG